MSQEPALHAKLARPLPTDVSERTRLYEALDRARQRPIVWITSPAGSGKTTLVASYCQSRQLRSLWYHVDERDRDAASLFFYLGQVAALESKDDAPMPVLAGEHPLYSLAFARRYFEALFERLPQPAVIVFDNCGTLPQDARWYEFVREGVSALPPGIGMIFISRAAPAPVFARLLASSRLSLLGWEEVRFTPEEATDLIDRRAQSLSLEVAAGEVARIRELSDGWAAGMVLVLECSRFEQRVSCGERASPLLFDYFATEVFARAEQDVRVFLAASALLPNMTAVSLDRLLGRSDSARMLERLRQENFFIGAFGESRLVYRYHPLFRQFLTTSGRDVLTAAQLQQMQREASLLLAEQGEIDVALELCERSTGSEAVAALLAREAPRLLAQGRSDSVRGFIEAIPPDLVRESPWLSLWAGLADLGTRPVSACRFLYQALEIFERDDIRDGFFTAASALIQALLLEGNDGRKLRQLVMRVLAAEEAGRKPETHELELRVEGSIALAVLLAMPQDPEYRARIERALSAPRGRNPDELALASFWHGWRGELSELNAVLEVWKRRDQRERLGDFTRLSLTSAEMVQALFRGDFAGVNELVQRAFELTERTGVFSVNTSVRVYWAYAHAALGDVAQLDLVLDDMAQDTETGRQLDLANYHFVLGYRALLAGAPLVARRHVEASVDHARRLGIPMGECVHGLGLAEALWHCGEREAARRELLAMFPLASEISRITRQGALLLDASFALDGGEHAACDERLAEAFALGQTHGFVPVPWPVRTTLERLCRRALSRGIHVAYATELIRKFALEAPPEVAARDSEPFPEFASGAVPAEFAKSVRQALRRLHEPAHLARSPLLALRQVVGRAGARASRQAEVQALSELLRETAQSLAASSRLEAAYRALFHTYLEPTSTQLLAAEAAHLPFGSYRRHLTTAVSHVTAILWLREQEIHSRARSNG